MWTTDVNIERCVWIVFSATTATTATTTTAAADAEQPVPVTTSLTG